MVMALSGEQMVVVVELPAAAAAAAAAVSTRMVNRFTTILTVPLP
jgi:Mrp family chromosome partitioning ATPase